MLNDILKKMGHYPTKTSTTRITYRTPFNPNEKTPSFCVFQNDRGEWKNYKDYSSGEGGDVYKFVMGYYRISFIEAKKKIEELLGLNDSQDFVTSNSFSFNQKNSSYEIKKIRKLEDNKILMDYLNKRGISNIIILKASLDAVYYQINNKNYFAIGFKNDNDGYEIRNEYFKGNLINKSLTTILNNSKQIKVFEGFLDYLSYLEISQNGIVSDYLILNSVSLIKQALEHLKGNYELIELYFDNDEAGEKATQKIIQKILNVKIIDKRKYYENYKDLNEYLLDIK